MLTHNFLEINETGIKDTSYTSKSKSKIEEQNLMHLHALELEQNWNMEKGMVLEMPTGGKEKRRGNRRYLSSQLAQDSSQKK